MRRTLIVLVIGLALLGLSWWGLRAPDNLAARADEAYRRGEYLEAVQGYQAAASETTNLADLAQNQAAALYRLERYSEADVRYQYSGERGDSRQRAHAEYNRGACALRQACCQEGEPNRELLRSAAEHFRACLEHEAAAGEETTVFADARHNLELAKLLESAPASEKVPPAEQSDPLTAEQREQSAPTSAGADQPRQELARNDQPEDECPS
jgi:hypothetical protein